MALLIKSLDLAEIHLFRPWRTAADLIQNWSSNRLICSTGSPIYSTEVRGAPQSCIVSFNDKNSAAKSYRRSMLAIQTQCGKFVCVNTTQVYYGGPVVLGEGSFNGPWLIVWVIWAEMGISCVSNKRRWLEPHVWHKITYWFLCLHLKCNENVISPLGCTHWNPFIKLQDP